VVAEPGQGADGLVDLAALGSPEYANDPMLGPFSACSHVTGALTYTHTIARLLLQHSTATPLPLAARDEQRHAD
jgi:hypothetical protein